jgi:serine/threonine protein kinase
MSNCQLPKYNIENHKIDWRGYVVSGINKYVLIKKLGHGSYSSVWMAKTLGNETKYYAIKIHNIEDVKEGLKEIKVYNNLYKLDTPNIINIVDNFNIEREFCGKKIVHVCMVMELMGYSTYDLITKKGYHNGLPLDVVLNIIKQILETLKVLHKNNIVHGDLKPENIMLSSIKEDDKEIINLCEIKEDNKSLIGYIKNLPESDVESSVYSDSESSVYSDSESSISENYSSTSNLDSVNSDGDNSNSDKDDYVDCFEKEIIGDNKSLFEINIDSDDNSTDSYSENDDKQNDKYSIKNSTIKLIDIGTCYINGEKQRKVIHTSYYRSPEVILRLGYDEKADMWALGCAMYELLTGKILFNPDEKRRQKVRYQLELMIQKVGSIPDDMISRSSQREIYFTNRYYLKGMKYVNSDDTWKKIIPTTDSNKKKIVLDFILKLLSPNPLNRMSSSEALSHQVFSL